MPKYWWNKKYGKESICGISHVRLRPGKNCYNSSYILTLPCNHSFYRKPIIEWLSRSLSCPNCRAKFVVL